MTPVGAILLVVVAVALMMAVHEEAGIRRRARREARAIMQETAARQISTLVGDPVGGYTDTGWTVDEREALGINDTNALIKRLDSELSSVHVHREVEKAAVLVSPAITIPDPAEFVHDVKQEMYRVIVVTKHKRTGLTLRAFISDTQDLARIVEDVKSDHQQRITDTIIARRGL